MIRKWETNILNQTPYHFSYSIFNKINQELSPFFKINKLNLSVIIVSDKKIRKLNRLYRGQNRVTDVLSFGVRSKHKFVLPQDGRTLGDIFISAQAVRRQAKKLHHSFKKEIAILYLHGLLHLLGLNHEKNKKGKEKMKYWENKIIKELE